jgi:protein O-GlcNAc transferase
MSDALATAIKRATAAVEMGDWAVAFRRWEFIKERFPAEPAGYVGCGVALLNQGRLNEAEKVLRRAVDRWPDLSGAAYHYADIARQRGELGEAILRFKQMIRDVPGEHSGYVGLAAALADVGRLDEAEATLTGALERFPEEAALRYHYADISMRRRDWQEALIRWELMREKCPQHLGGLIGLGAALRELGRLDDAEEILAVTMQQCPDDAGAAYHYAEIAMRRRDWDEALKRWESMRETLPQHAGGHVGLGMVLIEIGRLDEAEEILAAAMRQFPADAGAAYHHADIAMRRGDWQEALNRWELMTQKFPQHGGGQEGLTAALRELDRLREAEETYAATKRVRKRRKATGMHDESGS